MKEDEKGMIKEYNTRKEEGGSVVINLDRVEFFRPGRKDNYTYTFSGVDVWLMSSARVWIDTNYEDFKRDIEQNGQEVIL